MGSDDGMGHLFLFWEQFKFLKSIHTLIFPDFLCAEFKL